MSLTKVVDTPSTLRPRTPPRRRLIISSDVDEPSVSVMGSPKESVRQEQTGSVYAKALLGQHECASCTCGAM